MTGRTALPRIAIALGFPDVSSLLEHARREAAEGERFLEFRLDYLPHPQDGWATIQAFLSEYPDATVLATCRRHQNHGRFNGSIEEQLQILHGAVDAGAKGVDLEIESAESITAKVPALRSRCYFVLSYHNFETTPNLDPVLRRMMKLPADVYKVVSTARKPSDVARLLALVKAHPRVPLVLLAMGEIGFPSRILSPAMGGLYTYAAPNSAEGTAAGQVSAKTLRHLYRIDRFTRSAKIYGVIADPVRHSISPHVHNRAFQAKRMDAAYLPFLVKPAHLKDFMVLAEKLPVSGFSVTIPHKQRILRYLDYVDPLARRIGAVNTVMRKAGKWRGTNTDAQGVLTPLSKKLRIGKASVLLVGNGGAARGAAFALTDAGARLSIVGRNPDRVRALAKICDAEPLMREQLAGKHYDAVVHATSLGMWPHVDECFFGDEIPADVVFDMVYNPLETALLRRASEQGLETIAGVSMFLEQAAHQFETWTGESAPRAAMEKAALEALGTQHATQVAAQEAR